MIYILGNCAYENWDTFLKTATVLNKVMGNRDWFLKASFDKANRTSLHGKRGAGLGETIDGFRKIKKIFPNIKLITDVHECANVDYLCGIVDAIQIPAFLSRQTDLITECAKAFDTINIKRMQHIGPNNLIKSVDKVKETNPDCEVWLCDRGSNYGYDHLILDVTMIEELKKYYDKVVVDCTHSVQRSRKTYEKQGDRELAKKYFLSASVFGYDGIFAEIHPDPPSAISDGDCQIYLNELEGLMEKHEKIKGIV